MLTTCHCGHAAAAPCGACGWTPPPPASDAAERTPSRREHRRFIRRLWAICVTLAFLVFATTGGILLAMLSAGHDLKRVVEASTSIFQVVVLSYGLGFFVPAFLTSLARLSLGIEMSRQGLEVGQKTVATIETIDREAKPMVAAFRKAVVDDRILERLEGELRALRAQLAPPDPAKIPDPFLEPAAVPVDSAGSPVPAAWPVSAPAGGNGSARICSGAFDDDYPGT